MYVPAFAGNTASTRPTPPPLKNSDPDLTVTSQYHLPEALPIVGPAFFVPVVMSGRVNSGPLIALILLDFPDGTSSTDRKAMILAPVAGQ